MPGGVAGLSIEHAASLQCLERLNATILPVDGAGLALPPDEALIPENGIVAAMLVNNEVGTIQPVADFAAAAHLSVIDYFGDVPWRDFPAVKTWYMKLKSRPCFRPLLADRWPGLAPAPHYDDLDF